MTEKLEAAEQHYRDLEIQLSDPDILKNQKRFKELSQEHAHLRTIIECWHRLRDTEANLAATKELAENESDPELRELAKEELATLQSSHDELDKALKLLLVPRDPMDSRNTIMEIRAGTGGEEAGLFAADLFRMYTRFAETRRWSVEVLDTNETEIGGFKEIVFAVNGTDVFGSMRWESGVHRVQRIPSTESGGRIHTSAVTVAVLPEAEETDIEIRTEDLRIDTYRASGAGGQHVNKTESAVRITHLPTGVVVQCQDEKSQIKNRARAMKVLRSRLLEAEQEKKRRERSDARKTMVGSGDRSERIRTYNFPQNRLTDHRINLTLYRLDAIMEGDLGEIVEALRLAASEELAPAT